MTVTTHHEQIALTSDHFMDEHCRNVLEPLVRNSLQRSDNAMSPEVCDQPVILHSRED